MKLIIPGTLQQEAIPTVQEAIPTVSEAIPTVSEAIPTVSEAIPTVQEAIPTIEQCFRLKVTCQHEADESTITYDTVKGSRAVCKLCGAKIFLVRFVDAKRDRPRGQSKKQRRKLRRRCV